MNIHDGTKATDETNIHLGANDTETMIGGGYGPTTHLSAIGGGY